MKFTQSLVSLVLATVAVANPTPTLEERAAVTKCGQWDTVATGSYTVFQNLWNITGFTGSQCTTVTSDTSNSLVWSTSWSWAGGSSQVKSYANAGLNMAAKQVSAISTIPSTWKWRLVTSYLFNGLNWSRTLLAILAPTSLLTFPTICSPHLLRLAVRTMRSWSGLVPLWVFHCHCHYHCP